MRTAGRAAIWDISPPLAQPFISKVQHIFGWTDVKIVLRLLTEAEFNATFRNHMVDIKGREDEAHPDGDLDLDPYLRSAEADIEPLQLLSDPPPVAV
jgi:hypothetical protein